MLSVFISIIVINSNSVLILTKPIFLFLIAGCLILSFIIPEKRPLKIMLSVFFSCLLIVEAICYYLKQAGISNLYVYNLWFPVEYLFYTYWVNTYVKSGLFKNIYIFLLPLYAVSVIIIYLVYNHLLKFNSLSFQLGFLLLLPALLFKLYEYISENIIQNPLKVPVFWLITGLLFSYIFSLCQFSIQNYLTNNNLDLLRALGKVNIILTDVLYMFIIMYFILKWKSKKSHI